MYSMTGTSLTLKMLRRRAVVFLYSSMAKKLGLGTSAGHYECFVLATVMETNDKDIIPVFVCEFLNGRVCNVYTEHVSFIDTDDDGKIIL